MLNRLTCGAMTAVLLAASAVDASAAQLFSHTYDVRSSHEGDSDGLDVLLSVMTGVESVDWATVDFGRVTPGDVSRTVSLTPASGGDFGKLAGRLTDGTRHVMLIEWHTPGGGAGEGGFEPAIIWGNANDPRVDLNGYVIDALTLRVDRLSMTPQAGRTDVTAAFTLGAEGHAVPEPAAGASLLLLGGVVALRRRRAKTR